MSIRAYTDAVTGTTPQSAPLPGQIANSAGGYAFPVDDWTRLDRFLILGAEGGTFYVAEKTLAIENANAVLACLKADGLRVVRRIVEVSVGGLAPKNDPAIFALALAMKRGGDATRKAAQEAVPRVCRIGTHLFSLAEAVNALGGWGRGTKRAFASWYTEQAPVRLAHQIAKYQARNGWSHRDVLRLAKPRGYGAETPHGSLLHWATKGWPDVGDAPHPDAHLKLVWAFERAKRSETPAETVRLIADYNLPRECVRTEHLNDVGVWDALLRAGDGMPVTALVRNLGKMTSVGLLAPLSDAARFAADRLGDVDAMRRGRVHPLSLLVALKTYQQGHGDKGSLAWSPVAQVVDALDRGFYAAFKAVEPTHKRWMLALDVSGSMAGAQVAGMTGVDARTASAAMALVTAAVEPQHAFVAFTASGWGGGPSMHGYPACLSPLDISPRQRLDDVIRTMSGLQMGGTDCALPMLYTAANKIPVDVFVVYTDSETWAGKVHPIVALQRYRQAMGIPAKLVVVGMVANSFTIADPTDAGMLDVVGFDPGVPALMSHFATS